MNRCGRVQLRKYKKILKNKTLFTFFCSMFCCFWVMAEASVAEAVRLRADGRKWLNMGINAYFLLQIEPEMQLIGGFCYFCITI